MKKTDYANIAGRYDNNKFRNEIKPDLDLEAFIGSSDASKYIVLDLACGTGLYLNIQSQYFQKTNIAWHGLDASEEMLAKAANRLDNVILTKGLAEKLPYEAESFNFIINNYAFHHFENKPEVLGEIKKVLKKDGVFKMHNIAIHDMRNWWIYQFFPSAYFEDLKRFWPKELLFNELAQRGFDVKIKLEYKMETTSLNALLDHARNRDISALTIINDEEYRDGVERMEYKLKKDPDAKITSDFAEIIVIAKK